MDSPAQPWPIVTREREPYTATIPLQDTTSLSAAAPVDRDIKGGEAHTYSVALVSGQYLRVVVSQQEIDVFVKVLAPDGKQLLEVRNLEDTAKPERIVLIADRTGEHRLEVQALGKEPQRGKYTIKIEALRAATAQDVSHTAAAMAFAEAERMHNQGSADSRKNAILKYEEAMSLYRAAGDRHGEADTLENLASIHYSFGDRPLALARLAEALPLYRALGDRYGETVVLQGLGLIHQVTGESQKALEYYEQTLRLQRELGDRVGEAGTLNNIGGVYIFMDEYQKALDYFAQALPMHRALENPRSEAVTLNNTGEIHRILGEYQKALAYYDRSLALRRALKDQRGEATTLHNIALTLALLGEYDKAWEQHDQALMLRRAVGDPQGEASTLNNMALIYEKRNEPQKARDYYEQALAIRQKIGDRRGEANTLLQLGGLHSSLGEPGKALEYYSLALPLSRKVGDRTVESATLFSLARLERGRGNLAEARARIEAALAIVESLRTKITGQQMRAIYSASKQDYHTFHIDLLMQMHKGQPSAGYDAMALQASERARARSLLETLVEASADIRQGVDAALLEHERALQQQLNTKEKYRTQLLGGRHTEQQAAAAEGELTALLAEYQQVQARIRAASPRYAALTQPQPVDLAKIQRQVLDQETLLLDYFLGEERSFLWAVTPDSIASFELPRRATIEAAARRVYSLLTARNERPTGETLEGRAARVARADAEYPQAAAALGQILLGPVAARLAARRLLIVNDGALQYIPVGALPTPAAGTAPRNGPGNSSPQAPSSWTPLVALHEIVMLPSASTLAVMRQEMAGRGTAEKSLAVLADPVFTDDDPRVAGNRRQQAANPADAAVAGEVERAARDAGLGQFKRLRFSRQEAEAIAALSPQVKRLKAVDFSASRATATGAHMGQYRYVHFATHGLLNSVNPELSGIVLSLVDEQGRPQDGFLRFHEIYNLKLGADLVVLSACQTALGKEVRGEGLLGLTRGFMYAGARRVAASLWSVDDRATAELMRRFYEAMLVRGAAPAAALRQAQLQMWQQRRWQPPYYWAAFTLQGEYK